LGFQTTSNLKNDGRASALLLFFWGWLNGVFAGVFAKMWRQMMVF
jgi:hypothetical protein